MLHKGKFYIDSDSLARLLGHKGELVIINSNINYNDGSLEFSYVTDKEIEGFTVSDKVFNVRRRNLI